MEEQAYSPRDPSLQSPNIRYLLALNRIPGIGPRTILRLLQRWPNLQELFSLSEQALLLAKLPPALVSGIKNTDWCLVDSELNWADAPKRYLLALDSVAYPALLREISAPPPILFAEGDIAAFAASAIAMVGSRNPSAIGRETAYSFARDLSLQGLTIVSGLALGIDAAAHQGCLDVSGRTIAVLGTGINQLYPRQHQKLAEAIIDKGLVLSEFPLNTLAIAGHFPRRNRIISGLALSILVVEAAIKSGSLITARYALEQNRDVFAVPGSIHNPMARGCHLLLQQGAKLVTGIADIVSELERPLQLTSREPLPPKTEKILSAVGYEPSSIDQLVKRSDLSMDEIACCLAELELQGLVVAIPGGYMRCTR